MKLQTIGIIFILLAVVLVWQMISHNSHNANETLPTSTAEPVADTTIHPSETAQQHTAENNPLISDNNSSANTQEDSPRKVEILVQ